MFCSLYARKAREHIASCARCFHYMPSALWSSVQANQWLAQRRSCHVHQALSKFGMAAITEIAHDPENPPTSKANSSVAQHTEARGAHTEADRALISSRLAALGCGTVR